jgi:hypothetical protein
MILRWYTQGTQQRIKTVFKVCTRVEIQQRQDEIVSIPKCVDS